MFIILGNSSERGREVEEFGMKGFPGGAGKTDTWRSSVRGGWSSRVLYLSLSIQDLLWGPEGEVKQGETQSLQPLLTGLQQLVILLHIKHTAVSDSRLYLNRYIDAWKIFS